MNTIRFGTDGWRAVIAEGFTFANVARVAQATADFWADEIARPGSEVYGRAPKVVIGYDRRFFSDRFAHATAEVLPETTGRSSSRLTPAPLRPYPSP
jgi:phosphomannomutase